MIKIILFAMIGMFVACGAQAAENQCVNCHSKISDENAARPVHNFADWRQSVHAQKGVSCDACHGGNPLATDAAAAHQKMEVSTDPKSKIYFNNIPDACGACHARELEGFKRSAHYKELETSGRGPNCVTCHGSMAVRIVDPRNMETVCTLCHRRPTQAYAAYLNLLNSRKLLDQTEEKIADSKKQNVNVAAQSAAYDAARKSYTDALQTWHAFDMPKVLSLTQGINQQLRGAQHELKLKTESPGAQKDGKKK